MRLFARTCAQLQSDHRPTPEIRTSFLRFLRAPCILVTKILPAYIQESLSWTINSRARELKLPCNVLRFCMTVNCTTRLCSLPQVARAILAESSCGLLRSPTASCVICVKQKQSHTQRLFDNHGKLFFFLTRRPLRPTQGLSTKLVLEQT